MNIVEMRKQMLSGLNLNLTGICEECDKEKLDCTCDDHFKHLDLTDREVFEALCCEDCEELFTACICGSEDEETEEAVKPKSSDEDEEEDKCGTCGESEGFCQCDDDTCIECGHPLDECECD